MRHTPPLPTEGELPILQALWSRGPCTVRQVLELLERDRPTGYTTVLKLLQIMHRKGLVQRDETERTHVYAARASEQQTRRQLVRDLVDRVFDGSSVGLIEHALAVRRPTPAEAAEIRRRLQPSPGDRSSADPPPPASGRLFE